VRAFVCTAVLLVSVSAFAGDFTFQKPEGWTDLSANAPPLELAKAPAALVAEAGGRGFSFYAADLRGGPDDRFMENVSATVYPRQVRITPEFFDGMVAEMVDGFRKTVQSYKLIDKRLTSVGGVSVGRVVNEFESNHVTVRTLGYILPEPTSFAVLTYTTQAEDFSRYEPMLDAAAQATTGVAQPPTSRMPVWLPALWGGLAAGLVGRWLMKRKKA
jgi:hypothetical protein